MYHISLYENGHFSTHIGGDILTLSEALEQLKAVGKSLRAVTFASMVGIGFDREGTNCAVVITDRWGRPIEDAELREENNNKD